MGDAERHLVPRHPQRRRQRREREVGLQRIDPGVGIGRIGLRRGRVWRRRRRGLRRSDHAGIRAANTHNAIVRQHFIVPGSNAKPMPRQMAEVIGKLRFTSHAITRAVRAVTRGVRQALLLPRPEMVSKPRVIRLKPDATSGSETVSGRRLLDPVLGEVVAERALADAHRLRRRPSSRRRRCRARGGRSRARPSRGSAAGSATAGPAGGAARRRGCARRRGRSSRSATARRRARRCSRARARCRASRPPAAPRARPARGRRSACRRAARACAMKCSTSSGMSSRRSRSGGMWIGMTFRR